MRTLTHFFLMTQPKNFFNQPQPLKETTEKDWLDSDLSRLEEYGPYDWGEIDPLKLGKGVEYIPSIGLVIKNDQEYV
jgi:hypothetical protein